MQVDPDRTDVSGYICDPDIIITYGNRHPRLSVMETVLDVS